jgi:hypothetical protein
VTDNWNYETVGIRPRSRRQSHQLEVNLTQLIQEFGIYRVRSNTTKVLHQMLARARRFFFTAGLVDLTGLADFGL